MRKIGSSSAQIPSATVNTSSVGHKCRCTFVVEFVGKSSSSLVTMGIFSIALGSVGHMSSLLVATGIINLSNIFKFVMDSVGLCWLLV